MVGLNCKIHKKQWSKNVVNLFLWNMNTYHFIYGRKYIRAEQITIVQHMKYGFYKERQHQTQLQIKDVWIQRNESAAS